MPDLKRVYLFHTSPPCCLDPIPTLYNICLQADRARAAVKLEEEAAGIAQHGAVLIASP